VLNTILRGHYKIISHLGGGGFGQTYLAEDIDLPTHPTCVVKQLKPLSNEPFVLETAKRLFDKEAEILYSLGSHDRIPRLLAHFQEGEEFYLVQEFADGLDLTQEIGKGKSWSETAAIALLKEILEILVFVHGRGVVHRDIKPANLIRRSGDRKIVLIDFGAVKEIGGMAADIQGNTNLTIAIGSPGYMPIEQMNGKPRLSSDIYAVGMMVIQSITGAEARSFTEHPDTAELIWRDRLQGSYSSEFLDILDKMIRYDFRQRYQTAQEVLDAIVAMGNISNVSLNDQSTIISPINEQSELLDIIDKMLSPDSQQRYQTAQEVSEAIATMANIPNTAQHDLPTVITARITANSEQGVPATTINSPQHITASQNLPPRSDLSTPLPANANLSRFDLKKDALNQNLKCFPWKKVLIIGGIIAAISTIVSISKFSKPNPVDEVSNNSAPVPPIPRPPISVPPISVPPIPSSSIAPISTPIAPSPNPASKSAEELIAQSVLLNRNDKSQEALAKIEEALKLDSKNADAWAAKGFTLAKLERDNEAIVAFEKAIELRPEFPFARQNKLQLVRKARTKR
jgi:serine/threonine protein kinase